MKHPSDTRAQADGPRYATIRTLGRYVVSGGVAASAHFATLIVLVEAYAVPATLASGIGFCVGVAFNYTLQYYWTFAASGPHDVVFTRYVSVTLLMLLVNTALFWLFHDFLGLTYLVSQLFSTALVVAVNFEINRRYTFRGSD